MPVALLGWDAWDGQLGANPVNFAIRTTGILSLIFLVLSLAVTPASRITGYGWLGQFRRMLGLYAFFHAALHFLLFFGFDRAANVRDTASEIVKRPYLMVGVVGLIVMVPLAATSTNGMIKRLGPSRWKALHRLAYVAAAAGALHFYMLVKADTTRPIAFAAALGVCSFTAWSPTTSSSAPTPVSIGPLRPPLFLLVVEILGRTTEGRRRSSTRRPRSERSASSRRPARACRSTFSRAST